MKEYYYILRFSGNEFLPVFFTDELNSMAAGHRRRGHTATGVYPLSSHVKIVQARQGLFHRRGESFNAELPALKTALPIAGIALGRQRRRDVDDLDVARNPWIVRFQLIDEVGIRVVPGVRYTRWMGETFKSPATATQRNQIEAMISLTF